MKYVIQLIKREDGTRTKALTIDESELVPVLSKIEKQDDYILVIATIQGDQAQGDVEFSQWPAMAISTFIEWIEPPVVDIIDRDEYLAYDDEVKDVLNDMKNRG
ncbi:hypothetical protein [robinz microvirus RP_38]|nr:hypothetical protein [robinz microvirus RP_38]